METDKRQLIKYLNYILIGGIICVIDITFSQTTNGNGFVIDFVNDIIGVVLIIRGVNYFISVKVNRRYNYLIERAKWIAFLSLFLSIYGILIYSEPPLFSIIGNILVFIDLLGFYIFCTCMELLCTKKKYINSLKKWKQTKIAYLVIILIPVSLFNFLGIIALVLGESFNINLGGGMIPLMLVFLIPFYFFYVAITTMKQEVIDSSEDKF
ncbi:hypothetical protein ACE193_12175 [Bernardetia sp. OM2101]|uniref:hypothetical protein n=1 Tax=Bernardetia sp. OM2101 TaxID=3344876 RepID=UPI0035D09CB4